MNSPLFKPGRILATPGCLAALEKCGDNLWVYLARHLSGEWGTIDAEDKALNDQALRDGSRLLSSYVLKDGATTIWLITEAEGDTGNRPATTGILPDKEPVWRWSGVIRSADIGLFTTLLHHAAEIGVHVSFAYADLAVTYRLNAQGEFQCETKWLFDPDEW